MSLAVIGGSNFLSRYLIRNVAANYSRISLGDYYPQRQSVYALQELLGEKLVKRHLSFKIDLEETLKGADECWVVTHDYFKLALAKTFYIEATAKIAKSLGVKKLKIIAPYELTHLDPVLGDPETLMQESISKARESFPELSVIQTDLIFGESAMSLLLQHTIDQLKKGRQVIRSDSEYFASFQPVHESVVLEAVTSAKPAATEIVAGPDVLNWEEVISVLAAHCSVGNPRPMSTFSEIASSVAGSWIGDAVFPSHLMQFYRLLSHERTLPVPTIVKGPKMTEALKAGGYQTQQEKAWHRVIVD